MNRNRSRSNSRDSDSGYGGPPAKPKPKKKKGSRRNRLKRSNSNDSNFSSGGNDSDFSYPSGFIEPPAWNQPAHNPDPRANQYNYNYAYANTNATANTHSNHSNSNQSNLSGQSGYSHSHSSDERMEEIVNQTLTQRTKKNRFTHQQQMQQKLQNQVQQQYVQQQQQQQSYTSPENSPMPAKKKGLRRLLSRNRNKRKNSDDSISSKNSSRTFGMFRKNNTNAPNANGNESDIGYQSEPYPNTQYTPSNLRNKSVPATLSFGHRSSNDELYSNDSNEFLDYDPSQSHERDASFIEYEVPVVDKSDSEASSSMFRKGRFRGKASRQAARMDEGGRTSLNQNDHLQLNYNNLNVDGYSSSGSKNSWDANSYDSGDGFYSDYNSGDEEYSLNMSGRGVARDTYTHGRATDYSMMNKHKKDLASQNLQAIESMARKEGPNHADEAFQIFPNHSYPNTKMTRTQLRKNMNAPSAFYHDLRMPRLSGNSNRTLGKLRVEVMQCFGLPTTSLIKEVSAYAVAVMGSAAFQTDIIPNVANPMCELHACMHAFMILLNTE